MQIRFDTGHRTLEAYLTHRGWEAASLEQCPVCQGDPGCRLAGHGTYLRKEPVACPVARWYCARAQTTFSLLPEFFASRLPGTLEACEQAVAVAEHASSQQAAAEMARPAEALDAVGLPSAIRWLRRRQALVTAVLTVAVTLLPELRGSAPTVTEVRMRLATDQALVVLCDKLASHLPSLAPPVGFGPYPKLRSRRTNKLQHSMGPDPPPGSG